MNAFAMTKEELLAKSKEELCELYLGLQKQAAQLDQMIAVLPGHVYWKDMDGNYLGCNEQQAKNLGLPNREAIKQFVPYSKLTPEQKAITLANDKKVMEKGTTITAEEPLVNLQGDVQIFLSKKAPFRAASGEIQGVTGISMDVTTAKKLEEDKRKIIEKVNKSLAILAASIAHEMRNPLACIQSRSSTLQRKLPLVSKMMADNAQRLPQYKLRARDIDSLESIPNELMQVVARANHFINLLLNNVKGVVDPELDRYELFDILEEAVNQHPSIQGQPIEVVLDPENSFTCLINKKLMTLVLDNLLKNAAFHIAKAGKGAISISFSRAESVNCLYFRDTGAGIEENVLPKIFDHFFSRTPHGSGVGLAFCRMVMESFGGGITCQSTLGEYTEFCLSFPRLDMTR